MNRECPIGVRRGVSVDVAGERCDERWSWFAVDRLRYDEGTVLDRFPRFGKIWALRRAQDAREWPPVALRQVPDEPGCYFVTNGKHRLWVARECGWTRMKGTVTQS